MNLRRFLLSLRIFGRYRYFRRQFNRQKRENGRLITQFTADKERLTANYELRLETMRQEQKSLLFALTDKVLVAGKSSVVSHVTHDAEDKAERVLHPVDEKAIDPEKELTGEVSNFYLDAKEGFLEDCAEHGMSDADALRTWNEKGPDPDGPTFKALVIAQARSAII